MKTWNMRDQTMSLQPDGSTSQNQVRVTSATDSNRFVSILLSFRAWRGNEMLKTFTRAQN
ncbi:MAG: hypothetical protein AMXMBFR13_42560 [Phycisphaerae bacterium]